MGTLTAAGCGILVTGGVWLVVAGWRGEAGSHRTRHSRRAMTGRWAALGRAWRIWIPTALVAGVAAAILTGWPILAVAVPAIAVGIPFALTTPPNDEVDDLAALDRWLRLLGPSIGTGKSVRDAILSTARQAPHRLLVPLDRLVQRIDLGWSTRDALLAMADDIDSAEADGPLTALAMASERGGTGSRALLDALTDNTRQRLRDARVLATERAKPLAVARQVVGITLVLLGAMVVLSPGYFAPFGSPLGQALALGITVLYVGSLMILRHRMRPRRGVRFLGGGT